MREPDVFSLSKRIRQGEDISKELALGLLGSRTTQGRIPIDENYTDEIEFDVEQRLFEHRLDEEIPVESDIKLPETLEEFRNTFKKKYKTVKYRTDKVGYDFLRGLAHKYYETDLFPDYLGRGFCEE